MRKWAEVEEPRIAPLPSWRARPSWRPGLILLPPAMRSSSLLLAAVLGLVSPACSTVKNVVSYIPMPNLKMPSMRDVAKLIPGMPESDQVDETDPEVPFNSRNPLQTGHTLRLEVYEGSRDPSRVFRGIVMVDDSGNILLGEAGYANVGGKKLPQAAEAITSVFRVRALTSRPVTVHIFSVENTPVIGINGDVQVPENGNDVPPYLYGCSVESMIAKQVSRPGDLLGRPGHETYADGRRQENVVGTRGYYGNESFPKLEGEQSSDDN